LFAQEYDYFYMLSPGGDIAFHGCTASDHKPRLAISTVLIFSF